jgi:hypothetical protein
MRNFISNFSKSDKTIFKISIILIAVLSFLLFTSCATVKKSKETTTKETEFKESKKDSSTTIIINNPIRDRIIQQAPITDNPELQRMFDEMMEKLNTSKQSGDNGYNAKYDKELRQWVIDFTVGQTKNKEVVVKEEKKTEKTFDQNVDEYIKKTKFPWWIYVIAVVLLWPSIMKLLVMVVPTAGLVRVYKKLRNKPDKEL